MTDKFEFIDAEYAIYLESGGQYVPSIVKMCIWMAPACLFVPMFPAGRVAEPDLDFREFCRRSKLPRSGRS